MHAPCKTTILNINFQNDYLKFGWVGQSWTEWWHRFIAKNGQFINMVLSGNNSENICLIFFAVTENYFERIVNEMRIIFQLDKRRGRVWCTEVFPSACNQNVLLV